MSVLSVSNSTVRRDSAGRYRLNDLHRAAGEAQRHRPKYWLENQQTRGLVAEVAIGGIPPIEKKQGLGTFVCRELVYAYAMWISPAFHMKVIRSYDALVGQAPAVSAFDPHRILNDPAAMRGLLLSYCEKVLDLEETAKRLGPKADALDRIAESHGSFCLTDTAKSLQLRPKDLIDWLLANRWIYRRSGGSGYLAYQEWIQADLILMRTPAVDVSHGMTLLEEQPRIMAKSLMSRSRRNSSL